MAEAAVRNQDEARVPPQIKFDSNVVDICFHPSKEVIASGLIDGEIHLHSYDVDAKRTNLLMTFEHHQKACRGVQFHSGGNLLFSISKDRSLQAVDVNVGAVTYRIPKAHTCPIYSLRVIDDYLAATGDDDGHLKIWDYRRATPILELKQMEEYISRLEMSADKKLLLATSGEGTLTCFNIRARRMELQSENFDSEFLSLAIMKEGRKVVVGDGEGELNIFNWGEWGNISDRFPGNTGSVDCMVPINDDIICIGSMDGTIRAVNILPNRFIGIVGEHTNATVENLSVSHDRTLLASCSDDATVQFWDVRYLPEEDVSDKEKAKKGMKNKHLKSSKNHDDFFADMADAE